MLGVSESRLGFLMFLTPLAAMLAMRAAPWVSEVLGRYVLGVTTLCMALAFILPGQTGVWYLFPVAMLVCGATTGAVDVLMNARVSAMEVAQGRPLMNLCHAAYSFGASRWQVMRHVILPSALPEILTAMRIGIGFGWTTLVAAEMVAATEGLGYMVLSASQFLQTSTVIMGIIVIAIIAYAFDMLMRWIERKIVPWKGRM